MLEFKAGEFHRYVRVPPYQFMQAIDGSSMCKAVFDNGTNKTTATGSHIAFIDLVADRSDKHQMSSFGSAAQNRHHSSEGPSTATIFTSVAELRGFTI